MMLKKGIVMLMQNVLALGFFLNSLAIFILTLFKDYPFLVCFVLVYPCVIIVFQLFTDLGAAIASSIAFFFLGCFLFLLYKANKFSRNQHIEFFVLSGLLSFLVFLFIALTASTRSIGILAEYSFISKVLWFCSDLTWLPDTLPFNKRVLCLTLLLMVSFFLISYVITTILVLRSWRVAVKNFLLTKRKSFWGLFK